MEDGPLPAEIVDSPPPVNDTDQLKLEAAPAAMDASRANLMSKFGAARSALLAGRLSSKFSRARFDSLRAALNDKLSAQFEVARIYAREEATKVIIKAAGSEGRVGRASRYIVDRFNIKPRSTSPPRELGAGVDFDDAQELSTLGFARYASAVKIQGVIRRRFALRKVRSIIKRRFYKEYDYRSGCYYFVNAQTGNS
jgi:hypothetical protein